MTSVRDPQDVAESQCIRCIQAHNSSTQLYLTAQQETINVCALIAQYISSLKSFWPVLCIPTCQNVGASAALQSS